MVVSSTNNSGSISDRDILKPVLKRQEYQAYSLMNGRTPFTWGRTSVQLHGMVSIVRNAYSVKCL
jgi:hypothetical protein